VVFFSFWVLLVFFWCSSGGVLLFLVSGVVLPTRSEKNPEEHQKRWWLGFEK
jgi:phage shock protein PspC (stress-responsive transcriptional regulator)